MCVYAYISQNRTSSAHVKLIYSYVFDVYNKTISLFILHVKSLKGLCRPFLGIVYEFLYKEQRSSALTCHRAGHLTFESSFCNLSRAQVLLMVFEILYSEQIKHILNYDGRRDGHRLVGIRNSIMCIFNILDQIVKNLNFRM